MADQPKMYVFGVKCNIPGHGLPVWTYHVYEAPDGELVWGFNSSHQGILLPVVVDVPRGAGDLAGSPVTPAEAILVTGVDHPMAALDRLRDLVHAPGGG